MTDISCTAGALTKAYSILHAWALSVLVRPRVEVQGGRGWGGVLPSSPSIEGTKPCESLWHIEILLQAVS